MPFHVMIIPTLNCPGNCKYCWGSDKHAEVMDINIIQDIKEWLEIFRNNEPVHFTFHGGEPLLAGYEFYKEAFPILNQLNNINGYSMQSNLWLLDEDIVKLLKENNVALSTSIDGPKDITDYQRGKNYFDKTMKSVKLAEDNGLFVNYVCTFTSYSKDYANEIYDFFNLKSTHVITTAIRNKKPYKEYQISLEKLDSMPEVINKRNIPKKVGRYSLTGDLLEMFDSATKACEKYGKVVQKALKGQQKQCKGFIFKYIS